MKAPSDRVIAQRLLLARPAGPTAARFIRMNAPAHLTMIVVYGIASVIVTYLGFWFVTLLLVGMLVGTIARDWDWFRVQRATWPAMETLFDWEKIQRVADGQPSDLPPTRSSESEQESAG